MNLINKLLDNLEKYEETCERSTVIRILNGGKNFCGLTCDKCKEDKCKEQAKAILDEWRKEQNNNGWIPVEDRLPKDSVAKMSKKKQVLVCNIYGIMNAAYCHKGRWYKFSGKELAHIVAWQPLPPAFEVKEK